MKRKYVSPYIHNKRYIVGDPNYDGFYKIYKCVGTEDHQWYHNLSGGYFPTKELAKESLDQSLIEEGYTLLTQEQFDKFTILF